MTMNTPLTCFKSYDIRGTVGENLNPDLAFAIGRAFALHFKAGRVVLGRDNRPSSPDLAEAVANGLMAEGIEVLDLGLCGTEEVYFGTRHHCADGGICITASHNPIGDNGMKLVKAGAVPIDPQADLAVIKARVQAGGFAAGAARGQRVDAAATRRAYAARIAGFADANALKGLHLLVNPGHGAAGPSFDAVVNTLAAHGAALQITRLHHNPDSRFPQGIPNPLLPENQSVTGHAVVAHRADIGIAWDGDFDRCFLFDHTGAFVPGEYVMALLAAHFCRAEPGAGIVHDPRVIWAVQHAISSHGGTAHQARTGHVFLKQALHDTGAAYAGEMSGHHYFRDFMCCDSGMIPWLLVVRHMAREGKSLADLVAPMRRAFPSSGEVNFRVPDTGAAIARIAALYGHKADLRDDMDGLSLSFGDWRFNLRASNTEALLRLNVEARADAGLVAEKLAELKAVIERG